MAIIPIEQIINHHLSVDSQMFADENPCEYHKTTMNESSLITYIQFDPHMFMVKRC
jgi:hypothetical protein